MSQFVRQTVNSTSTFIEKTVQALHVDNDILSENEAAHLEREGPVGRRTDLAQEKSKPDTGTSEPAGDEHHQVREESLEKPNKSANMNDGRPGERGDMVKGPQVRPILNSMAFIAPFVLIYK